jgi:hypothetical protein
MRGSVVAGAIGGFVAFALLAVFAGVVLSRFMPAVMKRMMAGGCSEEMRACMDRCGCGEAGRKG